MIGNWGPSMMERGRSSPASPHDAITSHPTVIPLAPSLDGDRAEADGQPHYVSADTAPPAFAVRRSAWVAPGFLVAVALLSVAIVPLLPLATTLYVRTLGAFNGHRAASGPLAFRPFILAMMAGLSGFAVGMWRQRLRLLACSWAVFGLGTFSLDLLLTRLGAAGWPGPFSATGSIATAALGLLAMVVAIFSCYRLPADIRIRPRRPRPRRYSIVLAASMCAAVALTGVGWFYLRGPLALVRIPLVAGFGSGFTLVLLAMIALLFCEGLVEERHAHRRRKEEAETGRALSVAFLVPAHNEAAGIEACIRALDAAAACYPGPCRLYLVDNRSTDGTGAVAARALADCRALAGEILVCLQPGKAAALNYGLRRIAEDVVVRVDADTLVLPALLPRLVPWFWDESVGGVSGLAFPTDASYWFARMRILELYYNVGFIRGAQGAVDAIMVLPGLLASYRRDVLRDLDGFGEGFNGEDGDITIRIARLGYRIVTDQSIHALTEVPATLAQLREQRLRWSRSLFHVASRNMSIIWMRQGVRGLVLMPWAVVNSARHALTIPIVLLAVIVAALDPAVLPWRYVALIAGSLGGLQMILIAVLLAGHRRFSLIPWVPTYLLFRVLREYFALESLLTLRLK